MWTLQTRQKSMVVIATWCGAHHTRAGQFNERLIKRPRACKLDSEMNSPQQSSPKGTPPVEAESDSDILHKKGVSKLDTPLTLW